MGCHGIAVIGVDVDGVRGRTVAGHLSGRVTEPRGTLKGRGEAKMHGMIRLYILLLLFSCSVVRAQSEKNAADESAAPSLQTMAGEASAGPEKSGILFRTEQGELIPLSSLLGPGVVDELLQRSVQQLSVPDYTIARMEIRAAIDRDVAKLHVEMEVQVRADGEWISVPLAFGDVYLTEFRHDSEVAEAQSVLKAGEQNLRQWHLKGRGLHTLSFDLVGRARAVGPGVSQLNLTIPTATASHAVAEFSAPVELQRLPTGAVDKVTRDERGVRSVEFWGLSGSVALTWAEVAPPVASRPVVQVQNRIKLDLTTIPVSLTGTQTLQISGAPLSEVHVSYPDGFQLKEVNARNAANASVMNNFEILPGTGPSQALIRLTTAVEGNLTLQFDLELMNRAFPQDIRVAIPSVKDANVQTGDLDILFPAGLLVQQTRVEGAQRKRVTSESELSVAATAFRLRSPESYILLNVAETEAQFAVDTELTVRPESQSVVLVARFRVNVLRGSLLDLVLDWPAVSAGNWTILPAETYLVADKNRIPLTPKASDTNPDQLTFTFPERQSDEFVVEFQAVAKPESLLTGALSFQCPQVQARKGQPIVLRTLESDEYRVELQNEVTGEFLSSLPDTSVAVGGKDLKPGSAAWLHNNPDVPLKLTLTKQEPVVRASITAGLTPRENGLEVRETLVFEIDHRDLTELSLLVPERVQPVVRVSGSAEPLRALIGTAGKWSFRLPEASRGMLKAEVTWIWPGRPDVTTAGVSDLQIPLVMPEGCRIWQIQAGASVYSGIRVRESDVWQPVYSEEFESAWQNTRVGAAAQGGNGNLPGGSDVRIPVAWTAAQSWNVSGRPSLVLVGTQFIAKQAITTTSIYYESAPQVIFMEVPADQQLESIQWGSRLLTSEEFGKTTLQATSEPERRVVQWKILVGELARNEASLCLRVRLRQRLPSGASLFRRAAVKRARVSGEDTSVPVLISLWSQDEYRVISESRVFDSLSGNLSAFVPFGSLQRMQVARQTEAVLSPYPAAVRSGAGELLKEWLSIPGRVDFCLGTGAAVEPVLVLMPQFVLILATALLCVVVFFLLSVFRSIPLTVPVLTAPALVLSFWVLVPEWTVVLLPYVLTGVVSGVGSVGIQRILAERRRRSMGLAGAVDHPTIFGFPDLLESVVVDRREGQPGSSVLQTGATD